MGEKLLALDPKRRKFVEEFRISLNATQAAIKAGYSLKTARQQGSRLLTFVDIQEALAEVQAEDGERCRVEADRVIGELATLAFINMDDYMRIGQAGEPFVDLSATTRAQKAGLLAFKHREYKEGRGEDARDVCEVEIRLNPAKFNALIKLGEHVGLFRKDGGKVIDGNAIDLAQIKAREQMSGFCMVRPQFEETLPYQSRGGQRVIGIITVQKK
jgi:phage terminase small subunit